jgi:DNA-binding transcriptional LysR family regulator
MRMGPLPGLDIDLLRTFALIAEEGSFTRAAERVGRTQSAVSLQVQRLEALVGHRVFVRGKGGIVQLTPHGQQLLVRSHEMLALNDDIIGSLRAQPRHTEVRIGMPADFFGYDRPDWLHGFRKAHPGIAVAEFGAPDCALVPLLKQGELDLMLCHAGIEPPHWPVTELWRGRLHWITSKQHAAHLIDPLPLSVGLGNCPWRPPWLDDCVWRGAAIRALESAGQRYRIVSTSSNFESERRPVLAGLAVTVGTLPGLPAGLRPVGPDEGLPELPETRALLLKAREPRQPVTDVLAAHLAATFGAKASLEDVS